MASSGVNVKMSVTGVAQFKQDISSANQQIKTMDADLALLEKQFKATGDSEDYLQKKAEILKGKLEEQQKVLETAQAALESMRKNGVSPASAAFQVMQRKVIEAKSGLIDTETALKNVETGADNAGNELAGIGKGVSWENVTSGLQKITDNLERGAKAAVNLGKKILASAKGSTEWADELLTESTKSGIDVETLQKMHNAAEFVETDVETMLNARARLAKNKGSLEETLGFSADGMDVEEAFWKAGEAIMAMTDEFEKEEAALKIFGRGWKELVPLFAMGQEEYNEILDEQSALSKEQVESLGKADDAIKKVEQQVEQMKNKFWAENADKLTELLQWIVDNKDAVVTALGVIGAAFGLLKLGETAANVMKMINGFKLLKLGSAAGAAGSASAASAAASAAPAAGTAGKGWLAGSMADIAGMLGVGAIAAGSIWAADRRNNHAELVRGTDENLAAQSAGTEQLLVNYLNAMKAQTEIDWMTASEEQAQAVVEAAEKAREELLGSEGGQQALDAYSDWRQENSYGNDYWEIPEALGNMETVMRDLSGSADNLATATSDLPAQVEQAAERGIAKKPNLIRVMLDGTLIKEYVDQALGAALAGMYDQ